MDAKTLRENRKALGLTQAELGAFFVDPIQRSQIAGMEAGTRQIGMGMAARIREAFSRAEQATAVRAKRNRPNRGATDGS